MRTAPRLRVLLAVDSLDIGGGERHVVDLAAALQREGYEIVVACSTGGSLEHVLSEARVPVQVLTNRLVKRRFSLELACKLRQVVRQGRFQLVHAHMYASVAAAAAATHGMDVPLVVTEHSEASWQTLPARLVSRWSYRHAVAIIAVSDSIRRRLTERHRVPEDRISVIPNAVPADAGLFSERSAAATTLSVQIPEGPLVGVVARLQPEKGVACFLDAAAQVAAAYPRCRFLVVGDGPLRGMLMDRAKQLGLKQSVHFLGLRSNARALLELLDVLAVPSLSEGTPLVVLEAMSAGVPVVASAVGGIPEQIRHDQEGLLFPPGDARALAEACTALLRHPDRARSLGEAGRRRVTARSGHAAMVREIERVYHGLPAPKAPAATRKKLEAWTG